MRQDTPAFLTALGLQLLALAVAIVVDVTKSNDRTGRLLATFAIAIVVAIVLWYFARGGDRWPKWVLLVEIVAGVIWSLALAIVRSPDPHLASAAIRVLALIVLVRFWPSRTIVTGKRGNWL